MSMWAAHIVFDGFFLKRATLEGGSSGRRWESGYQQITLCVCLGGRGVSVNASTEGAYKEFV